MKSVEKNFANRILFLVKDAKKIFALVEVAQVRGAMNAMGSSATGARRMMIALSASNDGGSGERGRIHYLLSSDKSVESYF